MKEKKVKITSYEGIAIYCDRYGRFSAILEGEPTSPAELARKFAARK